MAKIKKYEDKLNDLKDIVDAMEEGSLSIEDTIVKYEKAINLYKELSKTLKEIEGKVTILENGVEQDFKDEKEHE